MSATLATSVVHNISSSSASSSRSAASVSPTSSKSQPLSRNIRMPYTPTSAMSSSAVHISGAGAGALPVQAVDRKESEEVLPRAGVVAVSPKKGSKKDLHVEVPKRRPSVDVIPSALPSPPLTRVGTNESRSTRANVVLAIEQDEEEEVELDKPELDITAWRESTLRAGEEGESPLVGEEDVDEDERFESDKPEPRGEEACKSLSAATKDPLRPLRIEVEPIAPSPPLWEVISPPSSNDHHYDIESQQHRFDTLGSKATSSKRLIPKSSYYYGPPAVDSAFGTEPIGQIGLHHPREVIRIERDYSGGELIQFAPVYPLEFEGRISATRFLESINLVNEILISAHSLRHSCLDMSLAFFTLQLSRLVKTSHYEKEMQRLKRLISDLNVDMFNPVGLNVVWPRTVAFMFLEIEYY